jgi:hypothetical protein
MGTGISTKIQLQQYYYVIKLDSINTNMILLLMSYGKGAIIALPSINALAALSVIVTVPGLIKLTKEHY